MAAVPPGSGNWLAIVAILGHRLKGSSNDERILTVEVQTAELLTKSWRIVPELVDMLHLKLAGSRNIEIR